MCGLRMLTDVNMKHILTKVLFIITQNTFLVQTCLLLDPDIYEREKCEFQINFI